MMTIASHDRIFLSRDYGEFRVFYQHVNGEPAMVLAATRHNRKRAYVICLSSAWKYADSESGAPTVYLVQATKYMAELLGLGVSRSTCRRLADAVVDGLSDLIRMVPAPGMTQAELEQKAERERLKLVANGETVVDAT